MNMPNIGNIDLDIPLRLPTAFSKLKLRGYHLFAPTLNRVAVWGFVSILGLEIILLGVILLPPIKNAGAKIVVEESAVLADVLTIQGNSLLPTTNLVQESQDTKTILSMVVTAYSSTPWETDGNPYITASGTFVRPGVVANNLLPIGTKIRIPELYGDRIFVVEDRMSSRKGKYQLDIWFPSYWEAKNFGAKKVYIEVLEG